MRPSTLVAAVLVAVALTGCTSAEEKATEQARSDQLIAEAIGTPTSTPTPTSTLSLDQQAFVMAARSSVGAQASRLSDDELLDFGQSFCDRITEATAGGLPAADAIQIMYYGVATSEGSDEYKIALSAVWGAASSTLCAEHSSAYRQAMASLS